MSTLIVASRKRRVKMHTRNGVNHFSPFEDVDKSSFQITNLTQAAGPKPPRSRLQGVDLRITAGRFLPELWGVRVCGNLTLLSFAADWIRRWQCQGRAEDDLDRKALAPPRNGRHHFRFLSEFNYHSYRPAETRPALLAGKPKATRRAAPYTRRRSVPA